MRLPFICASMAAVSLLAGCVSTPNEPTLTLHTHKSPESYTACIMPRLAQGAFHPTLSQSQRSYRVVVSSSIAADNVIDAYKAADGGKVFVYQRSLLSPGFIQAAKACA